MQTPAPTRSNLATIKHALAGEELQRRFREVLGKKAPQFMASIINAISANRELQQCDPASVLSAALVAASLDLPIDSNLGFAAIVPYRRGGAYLAQFQIMYKGLVQLAIRSGYYQKMNYSDVYEDELRSYNPITGEISFVDDFSKCTQRAAGQNDKIVGYYAWLRLHNGFTQELYMTRAEVEAHARRYSASYSYDLSKGRKSSRWSTDFDAMAKKTVLKRLLSKWGILSVEMQTAIQDDQKVYDASGNATYADNPRSQEPPTVVDALKIEATKEKEQPTPERSAPPGRDSAPVPTPTPASEPESESDQQMFDDFAAFDAQYNG